MVDSSRAIERFCSYLRMRTDHPSPSAGYEEAGKLFAQYAAESGFGFRRLEFSPGHPIFLVSWPGRDASAPSIVLLSHMDVVPVDAGRWTRDPWGGVREGARIYGRGAQDMKSVSIQYLEALAALRAAGHAPLRTVHALFVPDEEVGGARGIRPLLGDAAAVRALDVGFVLDEGLASPSARYSVFYGERKIWWVRLRAAGPAGHGSRFVPHTAVAQLAKVLARVAAFHEAQRAALEAGCGCGKQLGDFTTANVTMLAAGCADAAAPQFNVIPTVAEAGVDIRIPATVDLADFRRTLDDWCAVEGGGVTWEPLPQVCGEGALMTSNPTTPVAGPDAHWWRVFSGALAAAGAETHEPSIFPAATDSRWVRLLLGAPCLGFSPMRDTPILLHDHDEFLAEATFLEGIQLYTKIIPKLADDESYKNAA
jgi:aminoacylase